VDFITQTFLGAVAAQATMTGRLGRSALLFGALGGALPDFDSLLRPLADPALPFELHRHFTHSLLFIPIGGALAAAPFMLRRAWREKAGLVYLAATIGCATHGLLDNLTSYGTHLYWPFIAHRTAWDAMSIIDPIFTGLLIVGALLSLAIGHARPAIAAFALCLLYVIFGFIQHERAMSVQEQLAAQRGHERVRGRVMPTLGNLIVWRSVYEHDGRLWADAIRLPAFDAPLARTGESVRLFAVDDLPPAAGEHAAARLRDVYVRFSAFADDYTAVMEDDTSGGLVVGDVRYSMDTAGFDAIWGLRIMPSDPLEPARFTGHGPPDREGALRDLWYDLIAPDARYAPIAVAR
jgi:inner membrane protein